MGFWKLSLGLQLRDNWSHSLDDSARTPCHTVVLNVKSILDLKVIKSVGAVAQP